MKNVISVCAASVVPLKVVQTVDIDFVVNVLTNVTAGVNLAVKVVLKGISNVNTMGARRNTVMTVAKTKITIWTIVTSVMKHAALSAGT